MTDLLEPRAIGMALARLEGPAKLAGTAPYAYEHPFERPLYLYPVQSSIACDRVAGIDTAAAQSSAAWR